MALSEWQINKLNSWLKSKKINWRCPSCGHTNWTASDIVSVPRFQHPVGIVLGGDTVPMVQLVCENCAYIRFYAAIPMGLLEEPPPQQSPKGTELPHIY